MFKKHIEVISLPLNSKVQLEVKRRGNLYNLKSCLASDFLECLNCDAPVASNDAQCSGCNNEKKRNLRFKGKILSNDSADYDYGSGQKMTMQVGERVYKSVIFSSSPFFSLVQTLKVGEKIKVKGWGEDIDTTTTLAKLFSIRI